MPNRTIYFFFILLSFVLLLSCSNGDKEKKYAVSGQIQNLEESYILLSKVEDIQTKKELFVDSIKVESDGSFKTNKNLKTAIYNLKFTDKKVIQIAFVEGQQLVVKGKIDSLKFNGSIDTQLLLNYESFRKESLSRLVYSVRKEISALKKENAANNRISELRALEIENYDKHLSELTVFIEKNMGNSIAIYPTSIRWNGKNVDSYKKIVSKFKEAHPKLAITTKLENRLNLLLKLAVGSYVTDIKMPNSKGEILALNGVKKTYTLVDFWASWCPPCRTESVLLNQLYKKYHAKGFEIYGISLDTKNKRWLDALKKDARNWPNVSTLKGLDSKVAQEYGVTALPTNFIIDSEGKIIASNIHGKHLEAFIDKLFN